LIMEGVLVAGDSNVYRLRDSSNTRSGSGNMMAQIHEEDLKNVPIRIKLPEKKEKVQNRRETPERKGRKKMKVQERKRGKTSIIDTSDHVHLLLWDVAVCLPARNIHGLPLKLKAVTAGKKVGRKNPPLPKPKRCANKHQHWLNCPDCKVRCSRDDFLLDHIHKRHVHGRTISKYIQMDVKSKDSPRKQAPEAIFEDKEDRQVNLNPPKKDFQQNVDTTRRRLLLANDVEQNPGPRVELNIPFFNGESCDLPASGPYTVADHLQNMEKSEQGKFVIAQNEDDTLICCLNNYSETDGSFKVNDFVYTVKYQQESGSYYYCSCSIYKTLLNVPDCNSLENDRVVLDIQGNCVTCIHCRFVKEMVVPYLPDAGKAMGNDGPNIFVQQGLQYVGNSLVEMYKGKNLRKYYVLAGEDSLPVMVRLTFNKSKGTYIVTCDSGQCKAGKGHKKYVGNLLTSKVCKHLSVLKSQSEHWLDLLEDGVDAGDGDSSDCDMVTITPVANFTDDGDEVERLETFEVESSTGPSDSGGGGSSSSLHYFEEETGLWNFPAKSNHLPCEQGSSKLMLNTCNRDTWSTDCERDANGCVYGVELSPSVPEGNCDCGAGWLDENNQGKTLKERPIPLTVYTGTAPVKCMVYSRLCCSLVNPCKLTWQEGKDECLHVLSSETAAGDEIGWEYVSMVMSNTGCTFSGFCQVKDAFYKLRHPNAKFMDASVFIRWWFSWASSMKIDFRQPCEVCGFEPKRLCCDGTRVGVGFRHATFEEISIPDSSIPVQRTLHRRMDRCFLQNVRDINKADLISIRTNLDYLSRKQLGEIIGNDDDSEKVAAVLLVLPDAVKPSFERFNSNMSDLEKTAYAFVLKMLATTASVTSLLPARYCQDFDQVINDCNYSESALNIRFNSGMTEMRKYAPELHDLIGESMLSNGNLIPDDIKLFLQYLSNRSVDVSCNDSEEAIPQPGTYNPEKYGRAYYFNQSGLKVRDIRKFTIDEENVNKKNADHDDAAHDFERCNKFFTKVNVSAPGTSTLFLWFCADHGHCYGFHMTRAEGRKDPAASLYSHLVKPPSDVFYDFACNLQEYCLNRESGYFRNVRFFHDIFHGYAHKCSVAFRSSRLQGFESINSEICEQFNSFIQCIKKSARQMNQSHFCFYLQYFLHEWNKRKRQVYLKKLQVALAGLK
ncbi:hypothetical protein MAR_004564, partial [Mya arenaria]